MKKTCFICNSRGTSLIELIMALFIASIVIAGAYRIARSVFTAADREKQKSEMLRSMITVNNIIEQDIRMSGCGLPGNGIELTLDTLGNGVLSLFTNEARVDEVIRNATGLSTTEIKVMDLTGFSSDEWVCIAGLPDTIYREIRELKDKPALSDTDVIVLETPVNVSASFKNSKVYAAVRVRYMIVAGAAPVLNRKKNDLSIDLGAKLQTLMIIPKNAEGAVVSADKASVLNVVIGGYIGKNDNRFLLADTTEVNIRN